MKIKPRLTGKAWTTTFRRDGVVRSYGPATQDELDAESICRDLSEILSDPLLLADPAKFKTRLSTYRRRAVEIALGDKAAAVLDGGSLPPDAPDGIAAHYAGLADTSRKSAGVEGQDAGLTKIVSRCAAQDAARAAEAATGPVVAAIRKELEETREQNRMLREEVLRYRKAASLHVTVALGTAIRGAASEGGKPREFWRNPEPEGFEATYIVEGSPKQYRFMGPVLKAFCGFLPEKERTPLRTIAAKDVDAFLLSLSALDPDLGTPGSGLAPRGNPTSGAGR